MNKILFVIMLFQISCSSSSIVKQGYYEPKTQLMDEIIDDKFSKRKYNLIKGELSLGQIEKLNSIIVNTELHESSELITCEITGVILTENKFIYLTCGTAQLFIDDGSGIERILLNEKGNSEMFKLIKDIKNQ